MVDHAASAVSSHRVGVQAGPQSTHANASFRRICASDWGHGWGLVVGQIASRFTACLHFIDQGIGIGFTLFGSSQSFAVSQVPQLMPDKLSAMWTSGSAWMVAPGVGVPS